MRTRSPLTIALLAGWAALLVAAASCGVELRIAADPDGSADGAVPGEGGSTEGGPSDGGMNVTCDAAVASDPANCGACGHSCGPTACVSGLCVPERLAVDASTYAFESGARVAVRGNRGILTDGRLQAGGTLNPGLVLTFDPTASVMGVASLQTFQAQPSLAVVGSTQSFWSTSGDTLLTNGAGGVLVSGKCTALAVSPAGALVAARIQTSGSGHEVRVYDEQLVLQSTIAVAEPGKGVGVAMPNETEVLVPVVSGVDRCTIATMGCRPASASPDPAMHVAALDPVLVFSTTKGELRSGTLASTASTVIASGLVNARAVAIEPRGAYVLDDKGVQTTRYGTPLVLVKADPDTIIDFAVAPPWAYFITPKGFYRVHL
jgi:hypothetical protein